MLTKLNEYIALCIKYICPNLVAFGVSSIMSNIDDNKPVSGALNIERRTGASLFRKIDFVPVSGQIESENNSIPKTVSKRRS